MRVGPIGFIGGKGGLFSEGGGDGGPLGGGLSGRALPPTTVTLPELTFTVIYSVSLVSCTPYKVRAVVPETDPTVKVIVTNVPLFVTFPSPTIKSYTLIMEPAWLLIVPELKNVV